MVRAKPDGRKSKRSEKNYNEVPDNSNIMMTDENVNNNSNYVTEGNTPAEPSDLVAFKRSDQTYSGSKNKVGSSDQRQQRRGRGR